MSLHGEIRRVVGTLTHQLFQRPMDLGRECNQKVVAHDTECLFIVFQWAQAIGQCRVINKATTLQTLEV